MQPAEPMETPVAPVGAPVSGTELPVVQAGG